MRLHLFNFPKLLDDPISDLYCGGKWSEAGAAEWSLRSMFSPLAIKSKQGVQSPPRPQLIVDFKRGWLQTGPVLRLQDTTRGNPLSDMTTKGFVLQEKSSVCNWEFRIMPTENTGKDVKFSQRPKWYSSCIFNQSSITLQSIMLFKITKLRASGST